MGQRKVSTHLARLFMAGMVTAIIMSASWCQISASTEEATGIPAGWGAQSVQR